MDIFRKSNELVKLRGATVYVLIESNGEWWRYKSPNFPLLSHDNLDGSSPHLIKPRMLIKVQITHDFNSDNFITVREAQTHPTPPPKDYTGMPSQIPSQWMTPPSRLTLPATTAPVDHTAVNHLHHLTPQSSLFPVHGRNRRTQPHNTQAQQAQQTPVITTKATCSSRRRCGIEEREGVE